MLDNAGVRFLTFCGKIVCCHSDQNQNVVGLRFRLKLDNVRSSYMDTYNRKIYYLDAVSRTMPWIYYCMLYIYQKIRFYKNAIE